LEPIRANSKTSASLLVPNQISALVETYRKRVDF